MNKHKGCDRCGKKSNIQKAKYAYDYGHMNMPFLCNECLIADTNREVARRIGTGKMVGSR